MVSITTDLKEVPEWPPEDRDLEAAIGRAIIAWGALERNIDASIAELYRLDPDHADCITANLGTKAKLEIFQSTAHWLKDFLSPSVTMEQVDGLINDTASLSAKARNFIAHGQPMPLAAEPELIWLWTRFSARKGGPKATMVKLTKHYFDDATEEIKSLYSAWSSLREAMRPRLKFYDLCNRG